MRYITMELMTFWLIALVLIGITGVALIFARRYKNKEHNAGFGVAGWTAFLLFLWMFISASTFMQ